MSIEITSTAFQSGATVPKPFTGEGDDLSPSLHFICP
jgi:hypothetical protein